MELQFEGNHIVFQKELSDLDKLVIRFTKILDKCKIHYVFVSGYVAILFGRSRHTEDIDLFISPITFESFLKFWNELEKEGFECVNAFSPTEAFRDFLKKNLAIRFSIKGIVIPNFEVKFPSNSTHMFTLKNNLLVEVNGHSLRISTIELQIAYKLYLSSEKDIEDAKHLYLIFKDKLDLILLRRQAVQLGVEKELEKLI